MTPLKKKRLNIESCWAHNPDSESESGFLKSHRQKTDNKSLFKKFLPMQYKSPKIKRNKDGVWFVEYYFFDPSILKYKRFKVYEDINRFEGDVKEKYAKELRDAVERALIKGFNPIYAFEEEEEDESPLRVEEKISLAESLKLFIEYKESFTLSHKTIKNYKNFTNHFSKWLADNKLSNKPVETLNVELINNSLQNLRSANNWKGKTHNSFRNAFRVYVSWIVDVKEIELKLDFKKVTIMKENITRNEYYHGELRNRVRAELEKNPVIDRFCRAIYYTCLRPYEELCHIKVEDIDLDKRIIKVRAEVGKTGTRYVPICDEMHDLLKNEVKIQEYPLNYYLFSKEGLPGPYTVSKNYYPSRYQKIKKAVGLSEDFTMYSWKHTRVTDLLVAGYSDAEVMDLTGHRDTEGYDKYKRNIGMKLNSKIKGKTIVF